MVVAVPLALPHLHGYQQKRIQTFFNPESDPSGDGYHILQSKIAMGSGGLLGKGLGLGSQSQLNFLPEKHTDFVMAAVTEELGFAGGFVVFALCGAIILMALRMAATSHSHFGRLLAAGATATFAISALINSAMVMGLFPVVGVPHAAAVLRRLGRGHGHDRLRPGAGRARPPLPGTATASFPVLPLRVKSRSLADPCVGVACRYEVYLRR
ncbi:MAG: FtsW/RodA/SpoVE family cell cycle protein [Asticcacaulis sp.]